MALFRAALAAALLAAVSRAQLCDAPTPISSCTRNMDLVILVDDSGSIGDASYQLAKVFVNSTVGAFAVGVNETRVGVVRFSTQATVFSALTASTSYCDVADRVRVMGYSRGGTGTAKGLEVARAQFTTGGRPRFAALPRVILLVTDGGASTCFNGTVSLCCPAPSYGCGCTEACAAIAAKASADAARAEGITVRAARAWERAGSGVGCSPHAERSHAPPSPRPHCSPVPLCSLHGCAWVCRLWSSQWVTTSTTPTTPRRFWALRAATRPLSSR